jgi:hypothetical protein
MELVYTHSDTLYDMIPHAPHPSNDPKRHSSEPSFVSNTKIISTHAQTYEVNAVQSTSSQQPGGNKKKRVNPKNILTSKILQRLLILN